MENGNKLDTLLPASVASFELANATMTERVDRGAAPDGTWAHALGLRGERFVNFYRRIEVTPHRAQVKPLPRQNRTGFSQKEFADNLD
jgi:hypothetical protein